MKKLNELSIVICFVVPPWCQSIALRKNKPLLPAFAFINIKQHTANISQFIPQIHKHTLEHTKSYALISICSHVIRYQMQCSPSCKHDRWCQPWHAIDADSKSCDKHISQCIQHIYFIYLCIHTNIYIYIYIYIYTYTTYTCFLLCVRLNRFCNMCVVFAL